MVVMARAIATRGEVANHSLQLGIIYNMCVHSVVQLQLVTHHKTTSKLPIQKVRAAAVYHLCVTL